MSRTAALEQARGLLSECTDGVLSTLSVEIPGYPFGSVVPYCLDREGRPILLISSIAQHTRNIIADRRVSLLVAQHQGDDIQAHARLTVVAQAQRLAAGDVATDDAGPSTRYYRYFPDAADYHRTHDFELYRLEPVRLRYIGGFGSIHWLEPNAFKAPDPLADTIETGIVDHMNADHTAALRTYCDKANVAIPANTEPVMTGIDQFGFHLRVGERLAWFSFTAPVTTPARAREVLIEMTR